MNELLQILIYFFQNFSNHSLATTADENFLTRQLSELGVPSDQISYLLELMGCTHSPAEEIIANYPLQIHQGTRIFSDVECLHLNKKCRGLLVHLEQTGILNAATREEVIDELMQLDPEDINLQRIKWTALMILMQNTNKLATGCMERLLLQEANKHFH